MEIRENLNTTEYSPSEVLALFDILSQRYESLRDGRVQILVENDPDASVSDIYFAEIHKEEDLLTKEEEMILCIFKDLGLKASRLLEKPSRKISQKRLDEYTYYANMGNHAIEILMYMNQRLIHYVQRRFYPTVRFEDAIQVGKEGLLKAATSYDYTRGRFSTHAVWWIRSSLSELNDKGSHDMRISRAGNIIFKKAFAVRDRMRQENNRYPTLNELANEIGVPVEKLKRILLQRTNIVYLGDKTGPESDSTIEDTYITKDPSIERQIIRREDRTMLLRALETLPVRWALVLKARYGFLSTNQAFLTLEETAIKLGFTRQRAKEIEDLARPRLLEALMELGYVK